MAIQPGVYAGRKTIKNLGQAPGQKQLRTRDRPRGKKQFRTRDRDRGRVYKIRGIYPISPLGPPLSTMLEKTVSLSARVPRELGVDQQHCTTKCCSIVLGKKTSLHHRYVNQSVIPEVQ